MIWILLTLASAFFIGLYEVAKKHAVHNNAVWLVLLYGSFTGAILFLPFIVLSALGAIGSDFILYVPRITLYEHLLILLKTGIVLTSWVLSYFALKHLPITIASPIRSTSPIWTILGALIIYQERLTPMQWLGLVLTLGFFFLFSLAGRREGISFRSNKWVWLALLAAMFSSSSALFDKHLIRSIDKVAVQAFFTIYQVVLLFPVVLIIRKNNPNALPLKWRWTIPAVAILLIFADFLYFAALNDPSSLIAIVSTIRRGSVIVAFILGAWLFKERNLTRKAIFLAGILAGLVILLLS
ncbi:transporter family protein [Saccharicrinis carchari]|uniref:Transporter family protein n=1 Tax=Saccharicrinis carchari TaxID=1168039 RepID=A0A521AD68_SACCC|nr:DMT family transporter [Saccharicrinis carchari]SMO32762.1 transporter family protein [Saccharicrinis carchari]